MKIAVFDYFITPTSPSGSCILRFLAGLSKQHEFTVFAAEFANPDPARIRWVRVPVLRRPLSLLFVVFHVMAGLAYLLYRIRHGARFDSVLMVESNLCFGDVCYAHFCHRVYLEKYFGRAGNRGLMKMSRWLTCLLHSMMEPLVFRWAKWIVVPSRGLAREIAEAYAGVAEKLRVIANPVRPGLDQPAPDFDRTAFRSSLGIGPGDTVVLFVALGNFESKGLPLLLEALSMLPRPDVKLLVVGGRSDALAWYRNQARRLGIESRTIYVGVRRDVRPYFWASDVFVLPSAFEVFPLVTLEAASAGVPLIVTRVYGVEEFVRDGANALVIDRSVEGVLGGLRRFLDLTPEQRKAMGAQARRDVARYSAGNFVANWSDFLHSLQAGQA